MHANPAWWTTAIRDFGAVMGFQHTGDWAMDTLNLSVGGGRYLVDIERCGDEILVAVFRQVAPPHFEEKMALLLRSISFDSHLPFFLQAGLKGDDLIVLAARLHRTEAQHIYAAFEIIRKLYAAAKL